MSARGAATEWAAIGDDRVMGQVKAGSAPAFGVLYDRFHIRAYRVAQSVCRDPGRAEEAVQEAFLSIWNTRATYEAERGTVAAWVLTVTRYRAIDAARRNGHHADRRTGDEAIHAVPAPGSVAEQVVGDAEADGLRVLLGELPEAQREVITLAFYGELTHSEIAAHLHLPPGTVKGRMRLGLQKLRRDVDSVAV